MTRRPTRQELTRSVQARQLKTLLEENRAFRSFLWTFFRDAGIFYPSYSQRSPYDTAYNEGRRALGLEVLHMLKHVRPDVLSILEAEGNLLEQELKVTQPLEEQTNELPPTEHDLDDQPDEPGF